MHRSIGHQCCDQLTAVKTGYLLTSITWLYRGLRCWPIEVEYFFEVIRWQVTSFQMIVGSSLIVFYFIWNMFCYCAAQLKYWIKTDLGRKNLTSYYRQGRQLLLTLLTMVTRLVMLYVQFLRSDWSKYDRWSYSDNLCSILNLVYFDSWS